VRHGENVILQDPHGIRPAHTRYAVYSEMMLNIAMHYRSAPDVRTLTLDELEFFYNGIRGYLMEITKPSK
jgi:hypothetical protein